MITNVHTDFDSGPSGVAGRLGVSFGCQACCFTRGAAELTRQYQNHPHERRSSSLYSIRVKYKDNKENIFSMDSSFHSFFVCYLFIYLFAYFSLCILTLGYKRKIFKPNSWISFMENISSYFQNPTCTPPPAATPNPWCVSLRGKGHFRFRSRACPLGKQDLVMKM